MGNVIHIWFSDGNEDWFSIGRIIKGQRCAFEHLFCDAFADITDKEVYDQIRDTLRKTNNKPLAVKFSVILT